MNNGFFSAKVALLKQTTVGSVFVSRRVDSISPEAVAAIDRAYETLALSQIVCCALVMTFAVELLRSFNRR